MSDNGSPIGNANGTDKIPLNASSGPAGGYGKPSTDTAQAQHPSLIRRSSYDPVKPSKLGLSALPPPTFSRAPSGQRSVPAVEYMHGGLVMHGVPPSTTHGVSVSNGLSMTSSLPALAKTGSVGHSLGNGAMSVEPWNLWSDPSAPRPATIGPADSGSVDEIASALAASTIIDKKRLSTTSTSSSNGGSGSISADAKKPDPVVDIRNDSLLPRNVSFSSLLDLPASTEGHASNEASFNNARTGSLHRTASLSARSRPNAPSPASPRQLLASSTLLGSSLTDSIDQTTSQNLPALSLTSSGGLVTGALLPEMQPVPVGGASTSSTDTLRDDPRSSPKSRTSGTSVLLPLTGASRGKFGSPGQRGASTSAYSAAFGNRQRNSDADFQDRHRQASAAFSDASITSVPLGTFFTQPVDAYSNPAIASNDLNFGAAFGSYSGGGLANGLVGNNDFSPSPIFNQATRRDSGYGLSMYTTSPPSAYGAEGSLGRRFSQPNWGLGSQYTSPNVARSAPYAYNPSITPSFGLSPESHFGSATLGSSPSSGASSVATSPYRYAGSAKGFAVEYTHTGANSLPNYGLGLGTAISGYGGYPSLSPYDYGKDDRSRPIRSPLLEDFRADRSRRWEVKDMAGHIAEFMCDQVGSRYIQEHILEYPSAEDCGLIYEEVCPVILQLSVDVFANFCVQRLLEKAGTEQIKQLANAIKGSVLRLALQTYGCRVIQKAVEVVSPEHQLMIVHELEGAIQKCVRDQNANHVVQKVVQTVPADQLQCIVNAFIGNVYTFATHPYSCRVLQRILENCPERMTRSLLDELQQYAQLLMQDQYGNYVIQYIIEKGLPQDKSSVITQTFGQVLHLSKHKFASNVVEKCIMHANEYELHIIATEVLTPRVDGITGVTSMLKHEFANYPLQRLIKHSKGPLHHAIVEQVVSTLTMFRQSHPPFTAKHLMAVEKLLCDLGAVTEAYPALYPRRYDDHYLPSVRKHSSAF